ncbi:T9SS type B sorting domain-containing protein [Leeuwenhoekiella sp. H156]|uniref:T9SS type B sorting domain-containing protein n=1 Tax=Leeuwenhoekiella sp. H156 TaxID=3450128 RepID=UPI003FA42682
MHGFYSLLKKVLFLLIFIHSSFCLWSQKEAAIWYFGYNAGMDFNSGSPVALLDGQLSTTEGCATISSANGELLFYTDGISVWDRTHNIMQDGTGLLAHPSSSQSAIIIPKPGNSDLYYVFTVYYQALGGLNYSEVDITANGGLGAITQKNIELDNQTSEKLNAVLHANGKDVWVLAHDYGNNAFQAYLITENGVSVNPIISNAGTVIEDPNFDPIENGSFMTLGTMKVSPAGTKLAVCHWGVEAQLLDFDASTGKVSNPVTLSEGAEIYFGAEFSPSGKKLYISTRDNVFQYDVTAADVRNSEFEYFPSEIFPKRAIYGLQLGIDGKLYMANQDRKALSVINYPNKTGLEADLRLDQVPTQNRTVRLGLPPFIQSYFNVGLDIENLCFGEETHFNADSSLEIASVLWDFGDGFTSTEAETTHTYHAPGTYLVKLKVTAQDGKTSEQEEEITIYTPPVAHKPSAIIECRIQRAQEIDLLAKTNEVLKNQSAGDFNVTWYKTETDALNKQNTLPENYEANFGSQELVARIESRGATECYALTTLYVELSQSPTLQAVSDWLVCAPGGQYDFDFTQKLSEILGSNASSIFEVSFYRTEEDAKVASNSINGLYANKQPKEIIYFRIENKNSKDCYAVGNFTIQVFDEILIPDLPDLLVCDIDNDGFAYFNLNDQNELILDGKDLNDFMLSYHRTYADANLNLNSLNPVDYRSVTAKEQMVFVRLQHKMETACFDIKSFRIEVVESPSLTDIAAIELCDADNDLVEYIELTYKIPEILGGQDESVFEVSLHLTQEDANSGSSSISSYEAKLGLNVIFYRKVNRTLDDCVLTGTFDIQVYKTPMAFKPENLVVCAVSEQLNYQFDLSQKDLEILNGQNPDEFRVSYYTNEADAIAGENALNSSDYRTNQLETLIYARIENRLYPDCYALKDFNLLVNKMADPPLEKTYVICPDSPELLVSGGDYETYTWYNELDKLISTNSELKITETGRYTLEVSQSLEGVTCFMDFEFQVDSSGAPESFTTEISGFSDRLTLSIDAKGVGDFEYSVDGFNYQSNPQFTISPGEYIVYVRDALECRTLTKNIVAIGYSKFFTPNGDGYNDTWNIEGAYNYEDAKIFVVDRFGKLLKQLNPSGSGWDGTFLGNPLPSSEYWFLFEYDGDKVHKGHFTLKR